MDKIVFKLGYYGYEVDKCAVSQLSAIFADAIGTDGNPATFSFEPAVDKVRAALEKEIKKESAEELAQYKKYWMDTISERDALKKKLTELEG